jgi:hypothetical protein
MRARRCDEPPPNRRLPRTVPTHLREGLARLPEAQELKVVLAMAPHDLGQSEQAAELPLTVLAQSSGDARIQSCREAILLYARDVQQAHAE